MNKIFLITIILFSVFQFFGNEELKNFKYSKKIINDNPGKYKYLFLDKEIYSNSNPDLSDIRIVDDKGNFIPYYFKNFFKEQKEDEKKYETKFINKSKDKDGNSYFDFQYFIKENSILVNKLVFESKNQNFSNQIEIYGRNENSDWQFITKDTIYELAEYSKKYSNLNNEQSYNFYRIKLILNKKNIEITKCDIYYAKFMETTKKYVKTIIPEYKLINKEKTTQILINNDFNLKISKITFNSNSNFKRNYDVFDNSQDYSILSGEINKIKFDQIDISSTSIDFGENPDSSKIIKVVIYNNDDSPLNFTNISMDYIIDKLVFEDKGNRKYFIYFGNPDVTKPVYDIENFKDFIDKENQVECITKDLRNNKTKMQSNKTVDYKLIFNIVIIIISIILVTFLAFKIFFKGISK